MIIVSACLAGIRCRYDGGCKPDPNVMALVREGKALPLCPESLGGLPCPREPSEIFGSRVLACDGRDVTERFNKGAEEVLRVAKMYGVTEAILKAHSPSCGIGLVYDGSFSVKLVTGDGITARLLMENGINCTPEKGGSNG